MKKQPKAEAKAAEVLSRLKERYPEFRSALHTRNPYEKLVATVLSAQCTDERVNQVTPTLFARYPDARALARADMEQLEAIIHPTGFYHQKARHLVGAAQILVERHAGEVPADMDALLQLPGVARKTANCVLNDCFGIPSGVVVDTHVARVARRLGFTRADKSKAAVIERDLMQLFPREEWIGLSHRLIALGREICHARRPDCAACFLCDLCPSCQKS